MLYQVTNKAGVNLFLDSSHLVKCLIPEIFIAPTSKTLELTLFSVAEIKEVILKDGSTLEYKLVGNSIEFVSIPAVDVMVVPSKVLSLVQALKGGIPTRVYLQPENGQTAANLVITSKDFLTGTPGPISFSATQNGTFTPSLTLATATAFWIKGSSKNTAASKSIYLTISGSIFL